MTRVETIDSVLNELTIKVTTKVFGIEFHQKIPIEQAIEVTLRTSFPCLDDRLDITINRHLY